MLVRFSFASNNLITLPKAAGSAFSPNNSCASLNTPKLSDMAFPFDASIFPNLIFLFKKFIICSGVASEYEAKNSGLVKSANSLALRLLLLRRVMLTIALEP